MLGFVLALLTTAAAQTAGGILLTPPPRHVTWNGTALPLPATVMASNPAAKRVARILQDEMFRLQGVRLAIAAQATAKGPRIVLALDSGRYKVAAQPQWQENQNRPEAYALEVTGSEAMILSKTTRGLLYGVQTLLQLVEPAGTQKRLRGASIVDYPELTFRGIHLCLFPDTELEAVRRAILVAARYKMNAVVLELWASLKSQKQPQAAYENSYTPAQIRPLIELGRALEMEMIPALNSWGHMTGMRGASQEHSVLDRFPGQKDLYEPGGWSLCLSNPAIYRHLFDRYDELLELFGNPKYFHAGMDEAWGFRGYSPCPRCGQAKPHELIAGHIRKIYDYFAARRIRVFMWHDMFLQRNHPQLGNVSPANSVPPVNSHLALSAVPKDVILNTWNYSAVDWPVPKYFHDMGYPVVVSPWKTKSNTTSLVNTAKQLGLMGVLATSWDSADIILPPFGQAAVLAWAAPGFDLRTVPFDHWLEFLRKTPISRLPTHEKTLSEER